MELLMGAIGAWLGEWVTVKLAQGLVDGVNGKLNSSDLQKALKAGVKAADGWDKSQPFDKQIFYHCDPKHAKELLERFFQDAAVLQELQKPLKDTTTPDIDFLIALFKQAASQGKNLSKNLKFPPNSIETWLKEFVDTYFQSTSTYLKYQVAKVNYLKQLINCFDDVKFGGISVEGQDIEKSERLPEIFVMPDVVETRNFTSLQDFELFDSSRQTQLLSEQRQRALFINSSGRKILAAQLLNQNQSRRRAWQCHAPTDVFIYREFGEMV